MKIAKVLDLKTNDERHFTADSWKRKQDKGLEGTAYKFIRFVESEKSIPPLQKTQSTTSTSGASCCT